MKHFWNTRATDWINSYTPFEEVASIDTVQGHVHIYAGVVIGPNIGFDPAAGKMVFQRAKDHGKRGKEDNPRLGITSTDQDFLDYAPTSIACASREVFVELLSMCVTKA